MACPWRRQVFKALIKKASTSRRRNSHFLKSQTCTGSSHRARPRRVQHLILLNIRQTIVIRRGTKSFVLGSKRRTKRCSSKRTTTSAGIRDPKLIEHHLGGDQCINRNTNRDRSSELMTPSPTIPRRLMRPCPSPTTLAIRTTGRSRAPGTIHLLLRTRGQQWRSRRTTQPTTPKPTCRAPPSK